LKMAPAD